MTAAEAAASIAAQTAAAQASYNAGTLGASGGVFSLDQLAAMGDANAGSAAVAATPAQYDANGNLITPANPGSPAVAASMYTTAQIDQEWVDQAGPSTGLIAGGGNAVLTATGLQAGYYQIPGQQGAEYYDPSTGQASAEFVAWANSATPDALTAAFIPVEGGPAAVNAANQPPAASVTNFNAEATLINAGASNEDAQNQVLGIGPNQQFVTGANGQQETMAQAMAPQGTGAYRDVSTYDSTLAPAPTGTMWTDATGSGESWSDAQLAALTAWYAAQETDTAAAVAANTADYQSAEAGLQQENVIAAAKAAGVDPGSALMYGTGLGGTAEVQQIAETGISPAQMALMTETYNSIQDPAEQAAWIAAQDPGNLTASLRVARTAARNAAGDNVDQLLGATETYQSPETYGAPEGTGGAVKTTYGDITQTDATTGRSIMFGNVATAIQYIAPTTGSFTNAMNRIGGGFYGGFKAFIMSGGNTFAAALGALQGSGALGDIKMSLKNPVGNIGKSGWGAPQVPANLGEDAVTMGLSMLGGGFFLKMLEGTAVGAAWGGAKGAESGAISGALTGMGGGGDAATSSWVAPTLGSMGFSMGLGSALGFLNGGWRGAGQGAVAGGLQGATGSMKSGASPAGRAVGKYYYGG